MWAAVKYWKIQEQWLNIVIRCFIALNFALVVFQLSNLTTIKTQDQFVPVSSTASSKVVSSSLILFFPKEHGGILMEQVVNRLCKHLDDRGPVFQSAKLIFTGLGNQCYTFCPLVWSNLLSDLSIKK